MPPCDAIRVMATAAPPDPVTTMTTAARPTSIRERASAGPWSRSRSALFACLLLAGAVPASEAKTHYAPFTYRQTSGTRPYVPVELNGTRLLFMVHANASFSAMTTHANAKKAGIGNLVPLGAYGITEPGKVSELGSAKAVAKRFVVGGRSDKDLRILVFEIPQTPPVDGMIGIEWLKASKVLVDYRHDRLVLPESDQDVAAEHRRLRQQGYTAHPMTWDAKEDRYYVFPTVNGVKSRFAVSTVASISMDTAFASRAAVGLGPVVDHYGGPTGATGDERETAEPFAIVVDGQPLQSIKAQSYDLYAYDGTERPSEASEVVDGYLGCDFMRANDAVIDFGSGLLFTRPKTPAKQR